MPKPQASLPPNLEKRFQLLAALPPDWNSYGAGPLSPTALTAARAIVSTGMTMDLPQPHISPAAGGSVEIEWDTNHAELLIDVDPHYGTTYLFTDTATGHETEDYLDEAGLPDLLKQLLPLPAPVTTTVPPPQV